MAANSINSPEISVLIPAFNAEKTISVCLWSILNQSFGNFEILVYCDGCSDGTEAVVAKFEDPRIRVISSEENRGIVHARNSLISHASGKYLAWIDADDIMLPDRLAAQYEFLEVHPQIHVLGAWTEVRNSREIHAVKWPADPQITDVWLLFRNPLVQSSVMLRNHEFQLNTEFEYLEDYDFYSAFIGKKAVAIYPEFFCSYFEDDEKSKIEKYLKYNFTGKLEKIMRRNFAILDLRPGLNEIALLRDYLRGSQVLRKSELKWVFRFFLQVKAANREKNIFDSSAMDAVISFQLLRILKYDKAFLLRLIGYFLKSPASLFRAMAARPRYMRRKTK